MRRAQVLIAAFSAVLSIPMCSCYAYDEPGAVGVESYTPDYYEGNAVYFDNDEPYYYVGDEIRYVPRDRAEYTRFREHHVRAGVGYRRWSTAHPPSHAPHHERGR